MNIAVIFAGGVGKRMGQTDRPKQFMEIAGKPILIHTLEVFEKSDDIDAVVVACKEEWIGYLNKLLTFFNIKKVKKVVPGGESGQMSIYQGLKVAMEIGNEEDIVLIHDGVRPFIDAREIRNCVECTKENGSAISCVGTTETFMISDENNAIIEIPKRDKSLVAKAPQCFKLGDIYQTHLKAQEDGILESIDSCTLMYTYGKKLSVVMTTYDNIKITTPKDIPLAESIYLRRIGDFNG